MVRTLSAIGLLFLAFHAAGAAEPHSAGLPPPEDAPVAFGVLVEADGRTVADAVVELVRTSPGAATVSLGRARVEADGRFSLPGLSAGLGELLVRRPGRVLFWRPGFEIPAAGAADLGRIVLPRGETLTGRVADPQGNPLAGAEVWLIQGDPTATSFWGEQPFTRTGADGSFTVAGLPPRAPVVLDLCHEESVPQTLKLPHGAPAEIAVTLRPAGLLGGTVAGPDGAPLPGARVYARPTGGLTREHFRPCASAALTVSTDGEGRFSLPPLAPGGYTVIAEGKGFRQSRIDQLEVTSGTGSPLRFALERDAAPTPQAIPATPAVRPRSEVPARPYTPTPPVEVTGRLTGITEDEAAWAGILATLGPDQTVSIRGRVSADGSYRIAPLAAGDWTIIATAGGWATIRKLHIEPGEKAVALDLDVPPASPEDAVRP